MPLRPEAICCFSSDSDVSVCFQEQSRSDAEKLIAEVTSLVSNHMRRQKELVCSYTLKISHHM